MRRSARIKAIRQQNPAQTTQIEQEEQHTLSELMIDQLEIANIIIVNKKDLVAT